MLLRRSCKLCSFVYTTVPSLLFFLYERVRNLLTSVDWRDDYEESATSDYEAEFTVTNIAFVIYSRVRELMQCSGC
jgi:hypothetical protein